MQRAGLCGALTGVGELGGLVVTNAITVVGTAISEARVVSAAPLEGLLQEMVACKFM